MIKHFLYRHLRMSAAERRLVFRNAEQPHEDDAPKLERKEMPKQPVSPETLERDANERGQEKLKNADTESAREQSAVDNTNAELRSVDPQAKRVETPTPVGNLLNVDKNKAQLNLVGVSAEFADQYAPHKAATDRAYRVYKERPGPDTKQVLDTAIAAERSVIEAHQSEWKTGDDSLRERDFMNRLVQLEEAQNSTPEQVIGKREFKEREKQKIETQETEYEQKILTVLQNEDPRYPLPDSLKTFAQNALDRLHTLQERRAASDTWQAKQTPDVQESFREAEGSAEDMERAQIKNGYGIWQGTALESVFRDRYAQITDEPQFARESQLVKSDVTEEKQLGDWLDFQDKIANRAPGSTQARMRKNDPQGRLLFSNLSDFNREKFTREKAYGSLPTLTQAQFDKKYFNAGLFRSKVNAKGEFIPNQRENVPQAAPQLAEQEADQSQVFNNPNQPAFIRGPGGIVMPNPEGFAPLVLGQLPDDEQGADQTDEQMRQARLERGITDEYLHDLQQRAEKGQAIPGGMVRFENGDVMTAHDYMAGADDRRAAQDELNGLFRAGLIGRTDLPTSNPNILPVQPNRPQRQPRQQGRLQRQPQISPDQTKADAETELQTPTDDGRDWNGLTDVEKEERIASVKEKYGVSVDAATGTVDVPDTNTHEGVDALRKNQFDGRAEKNRMTAQGEIDAKGWDALSVDEKQKLTASLQIKHGVSIDDKGKVSKAEGRFDDFINRVSGHFSNIMKFFEKIGAAFAKAFGGNKPKNNPNTLTQQQKDLQELVGSITNDKLWHPAAQLKKAEAGYDYRIGKDGRAYKKKGDEVKVADADGNWKDIAEDMKIDAVADATTAKRLRATVANNGDTAYVDIGATGAQGWKYTIDGTRFIANNGNQYQQYNTANKTWENTGKFEPS